MALLRRGSAGIAKAGIACHQMPGTRDADPATIDGLEAAWLSGPLVRQLQAQQLREVSQSKARFHFVRMFTGLLKNLRIQVCGHPEPIAHAEKKFCAMMQ